MLGLLARIGAFTQRFFAAIIVIAAIVGFYGGGRIAPLLAYVNILLGIIMFGMGMTLRPADFREIARRPWEVGVGVVAQFSIMPLAGYFLAKGLGLPPALAVGVILVGTCPGGTASNVIAYLGRGDVALSVAMTTASTLLAPVLTPLLTWWLAGQWVPVDPLEMFYTIASIVLLPVIVGVAAHHYFPSTVERSLPVLPTVSVVAIALIVAAVIDRTSGMIAQQAASIFAAVILHNAFGLALGYGLAMLLRMTAAKRRTVSVEVGMQNSGLAVALARDHFAAMAGATIPGALFSVWHNITGPILASLWTWIDERRSRGIG